MFTCVVQDDLCMISSVTAELKPPEGDLILQSSVPRLVINKVPDPTFLWLLSFFLTFLSIN